MKKIQTGAIVHIDRDSNTIHLFRMREEICPICISSLKDPLITACGHHFCGPCLAKSLTLSPYCPTCSTTAKPTKHYKPVSHSRVAEIDEEIERLKEQRRELLVSREREVLKLQLEFMVSASRSKFQLFDLLFVVYLVI